MNASVQSPRPDELRMRRVSKIHFVGIGGVGMAGIAEVLMNLGYGISGSDLGEGAGVRRLRSLGARIEIGHKSGQLADADVVVASTAISRENPEIVEAQARRIPVVRRAEMLAELMRFRYGIAVAGTHGKTTTTSLVAAVLAEGGLDPTFVVGGKVTSAGTNAQLGAGPYLVAEADESDASFLHLNPMIAVVTNIDADHMETYGGDFSRLKDTFIEFIHNLPFYGLAVVCADDPVVRELMPGFARPVLTYGLEQNADIWAEQLETDGPGTTFRLRTADSEQGWRVHLNLPGRHNVLNALAAAAVGRELGVDMTSIQKALTEFQGIGRRCEVLGEIRLGQAKALLVDDYGHHPRELSAILQAARAAWPDRRLLVVFQPHRYTRTRDLYEDFCEILSTVDHLILTEVYAAGEEPIANADGRALAQGIRNRGKVNPVFLSDLSKLPDLLASSVQDDDVVLTLGAGDIGQAAQSLAQSFGAMQAGGQA